MADGTQFSDLQSCLAIDILLRLPLKILSICRYVRKDWRRLYFSDPYFIRRQLETSNIHFLEKDITSTRRKFRFGCIVDEVSTRNLRMETLDDFSCKFLPDPKRRWCVVNSCNGLVCLIDEPCDYYGTTDNSSVYVCNPILGEWVSIPVPSRCLCALGFSAKSNQHKILLCITIGEGNNRKYVWEIYTLGTEHWRSIETKENTKPWCSRGIHFNTLLHGSLHWTNATGSVQSFDFETERFTSFSLPEIESAYIGDMYVVLGVINGCLWASFHNYWQRKDGEMWAMKEYGNDKSWTMMLAFRNDDREYDPPDEVLKARYKELVIYKDNISRHDLLFSLNGEEMSIRDNCSRVICYNIKGTMRRRALADHHIGHVTAYNPSFVSIHDYWRGEQVVRTVDGLMTIWELSARKLGFWRETTITEQVWVLNYVVPFLRLVEVITWNPLILMVQQNSSLFQYNMETKLMKHIAPFPFDQGPHRPFFESISFSSYLLA